MNESKSLESQNSALEYKFDQSNKLPLYWNLPPQFLGNKVRKKICCDLTKKVYLVFTQYVT